jgi:hypothetical protein
MAKRSEVPGIAALDGCAPSSPVCADKTIAPAAAAAKATAGSA